MANGTAELEETLLQALADLKLATERRRSLEQTSPELLSALRRERRAMELVRDLVESLGQADRGRQVASAAMPDRP